MDTKNKKNLIDLMEGQDLFIDLVERVKVVATIGDWFHLSYDKGDYFFDGPMKVTIEVNETVNIDEIAAIQRYIQNIAGKEGGLTNVMVFVNKRNQKKLFLTDSLVTVPNLYSMNNGLAPNGTRKISQCILTF
jgi:hypothetical protein